MRFHVTVDRVDVREIFICEHGVQFLFTTVQRGEPHWTALVFPKPSRRMLTERLGLKPGGPKVEAEFEQYQGRYVSLLAELARISGGSLLEGTRISFHDHPELVVPHIVPKQKLALYWQGEELLLRGYLDVYFSLIS